MRCRCLSGRFGPPAHAISSIGIPMDGRDVAGKNAIHRTRSPGAATRTRLHHRPSRNRPVGRSGNGAEVPGCSGLTSTPPLSLTAPRARAQKYGGAGVLSLVTTRCAVAAFARDQRLGPSADASSLPRPHRRPPPSKINRKPVAALAGPRLAAADTTMRRGLTTMPGRAQRLSPSAGSTPTRPELGPPQPKVPPAPRAPLASRRR
jgi:hypothetical protein